MSLPGDALPNTAPPVALLAPDSFTRPSRVVDYERGGIALSDPSQGINARNWTADLDGEDVRVYPSEEEDAAVTLLSAAGITTLSLAFDQNMRPTIAYEIGTQAYLYWYDSSVEAVVTTALAADVRGPFVTMDDKRDFATNAGTNDVLLFYIRDSKLCFRQQRERYGTERVLRTFDGPNVSIKRAGINTGLRMQIELTGSDAA